jgi:hypothetical protein
MLLHEWWHVQGCELGPDGNDPRNDGPCGSCVEAQRGADDCNTAGSYICEYLPEDEQEDARYLWFKTYALTSAALNRCAYDGCPNVPNLSGLGIVLPPCCFD